ncbi:hypothetical protein [Leptospira wolbachii]|uniref:hypothetical protein n=1 Tax=Leptospira wolbachii TaxID=29511 RepID=UPI000685B5CC|nr:hypothetical protein [Leptospira wolbachii]
MPNLITIIRYPYEEPYLLNLLIKATNGIFTGELEIYDSTDSLKNCANCLMNFPKCATDEFIWELGSEDKINRFVFFFKFRVYITDSTGTCAINVRFNNNQKPPDLAISEFSIKTDAAGINNLGKLFLTFSELKKETLIWDGRDGDLY